jgi:hypothetical protein
MATFSVHVTLKENNLRFAEDDFNVSYRIQK